MRYGVFLAAIFLCLAPSAGQAESNYFNIEKPAAAKPPAPPSTPEAAKPFAPAQSAVITSVQKCYDQLTQEEVMDIKRHYLKPYEECQNRLLKKKEKAATDKLAAEKEALEPETPRNYIRVQKSPSASPKAGK